MSQRPNTSDVDITKVVIKPAVDDATFESLKHDFDEILKEMEGNKNLERFKEEYEKLMGAFFRSHNNEKLLMRKCRELKAEIISNAAKVAQASNISSDDPNHIASLKREIEQAWKMVDAASDREIKAQETNKSLKEEIEKLSKLLEQGETSKTAPESLNELQKQKDKLIKERDEQFNDNQKLREQIEEIRNRITIYQNELLTAQNKITELTVDIQNKNLETQRELRKKERLEKELKEVRNEVEMKMEEISSTSASVEKLKQELRNKDEENRTTKVSLEQTNRHLQVTEGKLKDCQMKLEQQIEVNESIKTEIQSKTTEVKQREEEVQHLKIDYNRLLKQTEIAHKKFNQYEDEKSTLEQTRDQLRNEIHSYENEINLLHKTYELNKKSLDELKIEKDALQKTLTKTINKTIKQTNLIKMHEITQKNLEQEILHYRDEAQKQRKLIYQLERERDHYITDSTELTQKLLQTMDTLKLREMQIFNNKKLLAELTTKLKQQENLYEAGTDPSTYEMIQKIQALQKRLISKTEEVVEKELLIQEKEKIYIELKHILARQPGPEVAEQLNIYQNMIKDKTKQMKAMTAEMNVYESQIVEYKIEIEHLNHELQNVKKIYFKQKRRQQQEKNSLDNKQNNNDDDDDDGDGVDGENNCTINSQKSKKLLKPHQRIKPFQSRFTGGGFKLTHVVS
ncbi:hypothetical protein MN116_004680 [Schistosoma mekongi]|uniref:Cilia- and flagella-associated protein 58 central coiled coil domain-containing protein n=1 Tax=Schistosoma mekongi TaxID=38744 RepID=A0AAE2D4K2_SCHME|nr:hypothetical protein MN116_004680 [Schistosoma mekongi]